MLGATGLDATLAVKEADGTGEARTLVKADLATVSPDGKMAAFSFRDPKTNSDLWSLSLEGEAKPALLLQTPARERGPAISPDGGYVA
jgi:hypothetical protein